MKRKQTRFTTKEKIVEAIDFQLRRVSVLLDSAVQEDAMADSDIREIARLSSGRITTTVQLEIKRLVGDLNRHREASRKMNITRHRIEDSKLPKLRNALAEFLTEPMSIIDNRDVVLGG